MIESNARRQEVLAEIGRFNARLVQLRAEEAAIKEPKAEPPATEYSGYPALPLVKVASKSSEVLSFEAGIREGRRQILSEQAANRKLLANHWALNE